MGETQEHHSEMNSTSISQAIIAKSEIQRQHPKNKEVIVPIFPLLYYSLHHLLAPRANPRVVIAVVVAAFRRLRPTGFSGFFASPLVAEEPGAMFPDILLELRIRFPGLSKVGTAGFFPGTTAGSSRTLFLLAMPIVGLGATASPRSPPPILVAGRSKVRVGGRSSLLRGLPGLDFVCMPFLSSWGGGTELPRTLLAMLPVGLSGS